MSRRRKMSRRTSKKVFKKGAVRTRSINLRATPMRGGFRI